MTDLPYVDTHTVSVAAGPEAVWDAVQRYADRVGVPEGVLSRLWGTEPPRGFAVTEAVPLQSLTLSGRHRFSEYRLTFRVEARTEERTTLLHAETRAVFPGVHGRAYRAAVIGTRLHVLATRRMLRTIADLA